jgi:DNA-binding MarR family transcriptional regulator
LARDALSEIGYRQKVPRQSPSTVEPRLDEKNMTQATPSSPNSTLIAARLSNLGNRVVSTASATYGRLGLGYLHARMIHLLGRRPDLTAARVAESLEADPGAVSRAVNALKCEGLLQNVSPTRTLSLTAEGWEFHRQVMALSEERERRLLQDIPPAEMSAFLVTLDRLAENLADLAQLAEDVDPVLNRAGLSRRVLDDLVSPSEDASAADTSAG